MFAEAIEQILQDRCTPQSMRAMEQGEGVESVWNTFVDMGFLDLLSPEDHGGAGLPLAEFFDIVKLLGRFAMAIPLAQSLAARAVVAPGVALPSDMLTIAPALRRAANGDIHCPRVPHGAQAGYVLAADGPQLLLLLREAALPGTGAAAGPQEVDLVWPDGRGCVAIEGDGSALGPLAAALHAALMAGAATRCFEMTLNHCNERSQFGKSLGKFQAVQHQLSVMAELVAAACIAAEAAFITEARTPAWLPSAIAKARTSEAAVDIANTAHALHGAIGVTQEYDLQLYTRRLRAWRTAHGSEQYWHGLIGEKLLAHPEPLSRFIQ